MIPKEIEKLLKKWQQESNRYKRKYKTEGFDIYLVISNSIQECIDQLKEVYNV